MAAELEKLQKLMQTIDVEKEVETDPRLHVAKRMQDILRLLTEGLTKEEFQKSFQNVINLVLKIEKQIIEKNEKAVKENLSELEKQVTSVLSQVRDGDKGDKGDQGDSIEGLPGPPGPPGENVNEDVLVDKVIAKLPTDDFLNPSPENHRDNLESLKGDNRLNKNAIKGLEEEFEKLDKRISAIPRGTIGGGATDLRIRQAFKNIAHTEAPTGDIDGANTTYTVNNEIFFIFGFTLNGEQIAELPNFTYTGRTITFSSALPAAYSGKDFECKYIG